MSEHEIGMLRTATPSVAPTAPAAPSQREVFARCVARDGRHLVTLRCVERAGRYLVECDVYPLNTMRVEPLRLGPHAFATRQDAERFVEEASLAFEYLGCELS